MKYIIDIPTEMAEATARYWNETTDMTLVPYTEPDRKAIENVVWEFAKTVSIMKPEDKRECWGTDKYNTINLGYSYQEAKDRYEAWRKQKDNVVKQKVVDLAEEIGVHRLYAIVREIRGE